VIRVLISDSGSSMLDLSTVRIAMRIKNNGAQPAGVYGSPLGLYVQPRNHEGQRGSGR
jgi:hypothetical protein